MKGLVHMPMLHSDYSSAAVKTGHRQDKMQTRWDADKTGCRQDRMQTRQDTIKTGCRQDRTQVLHEGIRRKKAQCERVMWGARLKRRQAASCSAQPTAAPCLGTRYRV